MSSDPKMTTHLIEILDGRVNISIYQKDNDFFYSSSESIDISDQSYINVNKKVTNDEIFSKQRLQPSSNTITNSNNNGCLSELFLYKSQPTDDELDIYDLSKIKHNIDQVYPPSTSPISEGAGYSTKVSSYDSVSPFVSPSVLPSNITVRLNV